MRSLLLVCSSVAATAVVVVGFWPMPYAFYMFLRVVVCGACVVALARALTSKRRTWAWALGFAAVLYNPVIPVHFGASSRANVRVGRMSTAKVAWSVLNLGTVGLLWIAAFRLSRSDDSDRSG